MSLTRLVTDLRNVCLSLSGAISIQQASSCCALVLICALSSASVTVNIAKGAKVTVGSKRCASLAACAQAAIVSAASISAMLDISGNAYISCDPHTWAMGIPCIEASFVDRCSLRADQNVGCLLCCIRTDLLGRLNSAWLELLLTHIPQHLSVLASLPPSDFLLVARRHQNQPWLRDTPNLHHSCIFREPSLPPRFESCFLACRRVKTIFKADRALAFPRCKSPTASSRSSIAVLWCEARSCLNSSHVSRKSTVTNLRCGRFALRHAGRFR